MPDLYSVRIAGDHLVFCAGHFITFAGGCEALHGHNFRASVELWGPLDPADGFVVDFVALTDRAKELVAELGHKMLVPTANPHLPVEADDRRVRVTYRDREWVFPRGDCVLLPVANTTAELLAGYLADRLLAVLRDRHGYTPARLRVEVEENVSQSAVVERNLSASG
jgi:6-pyruvoyltetrahydropterin/6-carboxytetrahydropterin synthase